MRDALHNFDHWAGNAINKLPEWLKPWFRICTIIGHPVTMAVVLTPLAYVAKHRGHPRLSLFTVVCMVSLLLPGLLKVLTRRKRPDTLYVQHMMIKSSSFPSGHAYGSALALGLVSATALTLVSPPLSIALFLGLLFVTLSIGVARVYLGAHYPSDVLAGWFMAMCVLAGGFILIW